MPLFEVIPVDATTVSAIASKYWPGLVLGKVLKQSQNHTYEASISPSGEEQKVAVRITPDPRNTELTRICNELFFVNYLAHVANVPGICAPIKPTKEAVLGDVAGAGGGGGSGEETSSSSSSSNPPLPGSEFCIRIQPENSTPPLIFCVSHWAQGAAMDFLAYRWITDASVVRAWGESFAQIHRASREFSAAYPHISRQMRPWTKLHDSVMEETRASLHTDDALIETIAQESESGASKDYGILHGDFNISNFFVLEEKEGGGLGASCIGNAEAGATVTPKSCISLSVFDWDQVQAGWWEYDLAQACITCLMLHEGGSLPLGQEPVPQAKPLEFQQYLLEGYETVMGEGSVNRERFARMIALRKVFYGRFCARALKEGVPPEMAWFIQYVDKWCRRGL